MYSDSLSERIKNQFIAKNSIMRQIPSTLLPFTHSHTLDHDKTSSLFVSSEFYDIFWGIKYVKEWEKSC